MTQTEDQHCRFVSESRVIGHLSSEELAELMKRKGAKPKKERI